MDIDGNKRVFHRFGPGQRDSSNKQRNVCYDFQEDRCRRFPCPYLHVKLSPTDAPGNGASSSKRPHGFSDDYRGGGLRRNTQSFNNTWGRGQSYGSNARFAKKTEKVCHYWVQGSCKFGDNCKFLHAWSTGDCFSLLTQLEGHEKAVTGIALPSGSGKLYTGSQDETVRVWDCETGQCAGVVNVAGKVGCILSEGPWVFVGLTNLVKAWNIQTSVELCLDAPVGQVHALVVGNDLLFAGTQDGILAWKYNFAANCFEPAASLRDHTKTVVTLVVGANRLYSGSMDNSIKVWSLESLQCLQTLMGHSTVVTSILCWDQFLLSCSLDGYLKVWAANQTGNLEETYSHKEEHGLITLCGMHDSEAKPVLMCSCNDNSVRVYDLPSFSERGKIFAKEVVRSIQIGPGGLFFIGDGSGQVRVWRWSTKVPAAT